MVAVSTPEGHQLIHILILLETNGARIGILPTTHRICEPPQVGQGIVVLVLVLVVIVAGPCSPSSSAAFLEHVTTGAGLGCGP